MTLFSRRTLLRQGAAALAVATLPATAFAARARIEPLALGPVTVFSGAGCNVAALPTADGLVLVDGGYRVHSTALLRAIRRHTRTRPVHTLFNTHWHPQQTGSNEILGRQGARLFAHEKTRLWLGRSSISNAFEGSYGPLPDVARPTGVTRSDGSLQIAGQQIDYGYLPQAHTDADLYVHFREADVLVAGGPVAGDGWPLLDIGNGAWIGGLVRAYEKLLGTVGPSTRIVSAHGPVMTRADIEPHLEMYTTLFERLIASLNKGMGPEDVITERIAAEYEESMGEAGRFLDAAFRSLALAYAPD